MNAVAEKKNRTEKKRTSGGQRFIPYRIGPQTDPVMRELFQLANEVRISRQDLAKRAGIEPSRISFWEAGQRGRIDMVGACFQALGYELVPRRIAARANKRVSDEMAAENKRLREAIEYYEIGVCAVGVPHEEERKVLHDCVREARALAAKEDSK